MESVACHSIGLPPYLCLTVALIKEELKSRHFFNALRGAGVDGSFYQTDLGNIILHRLGLDADASDVQKLYYHAVEKYSERIAPTNDSVTRHALDLLMELLLEKRRRHAARKHKTT